MAKAKKTPTVFSLSKKVNELTAHVEELTVHAQDLEEIQRKNTRKIDKIAKIQEANLNLRYKEKSH